MADRVTLFIDYQNVYKCARDAHEGAQAPSSFGQIDPWALGELICAKKLPLGTATPRTLDAVRVYSGRPSLARDAKGYGANRRQSSVWEAKGVTVITRTLRYAPNGSAQEKGIDVSLAIDVAAGAVDGSYDVGIVFSTDTDLIPALEFVMARSSLRAIVEVAAWADHSNSPLQVAGQHVWCHRLSKSDYEQVRDPTNYLTVTRNAT